MKEPFVFEEISDEKISRLCWIGGTWRFRTFLPTFEFTTIQQYIDKYGIDELTRIVEGEITLPQLDIVVIGPTHSERTVKNLLSRERSYTPALKMLQLLSVMKLFKGTVMLTQINRECAEFRISRQPIF